MSDTTRSNMVMHQTDVRPWGEYEVVLDAPDVKIKLIEVFPGQRMSYQYR